MKTLTRQYGVKWAMRCIALHFIHLPDTYAYKYQSLSLFNNYLSYVLSIINRNQVRSDSEKRALFGNAFLTLTPSNPRGR